MQLMASLLPKRLPTPFKMVPDYGDGINATEPCNVCEAEFELPTDGTPDTRNTLVVRVAWESTSEQAQVTLSNRMYTDQQHDTQIITQSVHINRLTGLLYGYAQLWTKKVLVPL